jgi:hypothetical protein
LGGGEVLMSKNILAAVLLHLLLVFGHTFAMDYPGMPKQGILAEKKDPAVIAIDLADNYVKAISKEDKIKALGLLSAHLDRTVSNESNSLLSEVLYRGEPNWISIFQAGRLAGDDNGDKTIQAFKKNIYDSYYSKKDKNFICTALQETAKSLRKTETQHALEMGAVYRTDLSILLSLLADKLPSRTNKINVLKGDLENKKKYGGLFTQAITEICEEKKSIVEQAQDIVQQTELTIQGKEAKIQDLLSKAEINQPKSGLLLLLRNQDISDLKVIQNALLQKQSDGAEGSYDQVLLEQIRLVQAKNWVKDIGRFDPDASIELISGHFKKIVTIINRLKSVQIQNQTDKEIPKLLNKCRNQLDTDANIIIKKLLLDEASDNEVSKIFPSTDQELGKYYNKFLWEKLKSENFLDGLPQHSNYFKKFSQFLENVRNSADSSEIDRYEKILQEQAIIALACSITSNPIVPQISYFNDTYDLKAYKKLEDKIHVLNSDMYSIDEREKNIAVLQKIAKQISILGKSQTADLKNIVPFDFNVLNIAFIKVNYPESFLSLWKSLEGGGMGIQALNFANVIGIVGAYLPYLNSEDIQQIKKLTVYPQFIEFFGSGFNRLAGMDKTLFLQSYKKVCSRIDGLPLLGEQVQELAMPNQVLVAQNNEAGIDREQEEAGQQEGDFQQDEFLEGVQEPEVQMAPVVPVPPAQQRQAQQPEEPGFIERVILIWKAVFDNFTAGLTELWRMLVG